MLAREVTVFGVVTSPATNEPKSNEPKSDLDHLRELQALVDREASGGGFTDKELRELPRLYRHASSISARLETSRQHPRVGASAKRLVQRAHRLLYGDRDLQRTGILRRAYRLFAQQCPQTIRREWRLLTLSLALVYGLALISWYAVSQNLDLAPSLLDPRMVAMEISQLQEARENGEVFKGNFTFAVKDSPATAGMLMLNNIRVSLLFFTSALIPPLYVYVLSTNALMLGTYTGVAGHWGATGEISSILWCHGVLEIQAIILSGLAGLVMARGLIRPGPWTRRHALKLETKRAMVLLAPMFPMLILAGLIEGFISPHAPTSLRLAVAVLTGFLLLAWVLLGGRQHRVRHKAAA